jgi:hypothetical protein
MRRTALTVAVTTMLTGSAQAANLAVITSPPTILNLIIMLLAIAGIVIGIQLMNSMKGGLLGRAWQIFIVGFGVLVLGQASVLLQTFEIIVLPDWVAPGLMVLWAGLFFYGVFETKRVLA